MPACAARCRTQHLAAELLLAGGEGGLDAALWALALPQQMPAALSATLLCMGSTLTDSEPYLGEHLGGLLLGGGGNAGWVGG